MDKFILKQEAQKLKKPITSKKTKPLINPDKLIKNTKESQGLLNNIFFYILIIILGYLVFSVAFQNELGKDVRPLSEVITQINNGKVQDITVAGDTIEILLRDGTKFSSRKEVTVSFDEVLKNNNVDRSKIFGKITVEQRITADQIITPLIMVGLPLAILFFIFKQMKNTGDGIFSFGKSRARLFSRESSKINFADVAGNEEAKKEMMEIVDFLKNAGKYRKLGARIPKGVLLVGPSGVGKTLLAKAIAGEANVPFFNVAGSEFMEMLVGVGSARVRDLFAVAKANQPSLIFIDEIDAIGRQRGIGVGGGQDEREQTLNQILTEMDGFDTRTNVIVIAATNRGDMLDPALIRAGRFDRRITLTLPDLKDREEIIKIHMRGKPFSPDVNIEKIAKKTVGFSGADIENMLNEAAILAARTSRASIIPEDIDEASLKITLGYQRKTFQTEEERKLTAYHEAGHALVASSMPAMDPVQRVSIVARGGTLGHTSLPPERDRYNETKGRLLAMIATTLGGRAAEDVIFNEFTTGASDDIERATELAKRMVTEFGMSSLGPISFEGKEGKFGWMRQYGEMSKYSEDIAAKIDVEINKIIQDCYSKAKDILTQKRVILDRIANSLLEKETIESEEYKELTKE